MTTIPPEKFEEWWIEHRAAWWNKCTEKPCDGVLTCDDCKLQICEMFLSVYLSIKSKEYMEANQ